MKKHKPESASQIIYERFFAGDPDAQSVLDDERANVGVAESIRTLRESSGLTQRELAEKIGTTASVICRMENADYEGHSLSMLNRIAGALGKRVDIRFLNTRAPV